MQLTFRISKRKASEWLCFGASGEKQVVCFFTFNRGNLLKIKA